VFRTLSAEHGLGIAANARLMGMLYLTTADAAIGCWNDKARWLFWRPITAIREAATDGNRATVADAEWLPLLATPPYPDHPSGFNCLTGSFMRTLRDFFGTDRMAFTVTNTGTGVTRAYTRFTDVPEETIDARIYQGLHFRTADEQGRSWGRTSRATAHGTTSIRRTRGGADHEQRTAHTAPPHTVDATDATARLAKPKRLPDLKAGSSRRLVFVRSGRERRRRRAALGQP
jgi:hypothetical protein